MSEKPGKPQMHYIIGEAMRAYIGGAAYCCGHVAMFVLFNNLFLSVVSA